MTREPELPDDLQVIARCGRARIPGQALGEETRVGVLQRRPRPDQRGGEEDG
jgi:hypothetical protein